MKNCKFNHLNHLFLITYTHIKNFKIFRFNKKKYINSQELKRKKLEIILKINILELKVKFLSCTIRSFVKNKKKIIINFKLMFK